MKTLFHVKGVPFFSVGGQVNNSTSYSAEKVETVFSHVKDFGLNTVAGAGLLGTSGTGRGTL